MTEQALGLQPERCPGEVELKINGECPEVPESPSKSQPGALPRDQTKEVLSPPRSPSQMDSPTQGGLSQPIVFKRPTESEFNSWDLVKVRNELKVAEITFDSKASLQALKKVFCLYVANQEAKNNKRNRGSPGEQSPSKQVREAGRRFGPAEKPENQFK